jgi:uridine kinase
MHVLVTGAFGSGATTLGRTLSVRLGSSFLDADDYYWMPTDPPYEEKRDPAADSGRGAGEPGEDQRTAK